MQKAAFAAIAILVALQVSGDAAAPAKTPRLDIQTLSTHADRVTGGDVLVAIAMPGGTAASTASPDVRLNGRDVSNAFRLENGRYVGLVAGLVDGRNELNVSGWGVRDQLLTITNYAITGPVISGPHQQPFVCQTDTFKLPDGSTLTDATRPTVRLQADPQEVRLKPDTTYVDTTNDCSAPTKVQYVYMPYDGKEPKPLADTRELPADVATITTSAAGPCRSSFASRPGR
jgi:Tannase-like family of unknown function (DUF6351)